MKRLFFIAIAAILLPSGALAAEGPKIDINRAAAERGKDVFFSSCNACHGLKYYRDKEHMQGFPPMMDPNTAQASFGIVPPDLSLMASARGKGVEGALYIYDLLTSYYMDKDGKIKNRAFAKETQTEGAIAMPQPIAETDPGLKEKAMDVAVFLYTVADPSETERCSLGKYVMGYMVVMTILLFVLNKVTWKKVNKKLEK